MSFLSVQPTLVLGEMPACEMGVEDFMSLKLDVTINEDHDGVRTYADVGTIEGAIDSEPVRFYVKRTYHEPLANAFRQMSAIRIPHYNTMREAMASRNMEELGLPVAHVVAYGERKNFGIPRCSFVITTEIEGALLCDVVKGLQRRERIAAAREWGKLLARLHDKGFFHRAKFNDIIYRKTGEDSCELVLIDRDVKSPRPKKLCLRLLAVRNAATNIRLTVKNFPITASEGLSFLRGYKSHSELFRDVSKREWYYRVKSKIEKLLKRKEPIWRKAGIKWRQ